MNRRSTQFGVRKNPDSQRVHGLRLAIENRFRSMPAEDVNPRGGFNDPRHAASPYAATGGERKDTNHLLTVGEVAQLLQVPVSWVYEQTRRRCSNRIPGFRLGKYWRFCSEDVAAWLASKRTNDYHHARESR